MAFQTKRVGPGVAERDVTPTPYRANTPGRLADLLEATGLARVSTEFVATLHRCGAERAVLPWLLRGFERTLPPSLRSTIVAPYRAA
ncbi:MAG TPA: hypothetical protein VK915_06385 [Gaiellaceae bacterium]|nr:hypothetical protein [Gaiellaceae bacterium]